MSDLPNRIIIAQVFRRKVGIPILHREDATQRKLNRSNSTWPIKK